MLIDLITALEAAEKESNRLDALWEAEPENAEFEAAWEKAYAAEYKAAVKLQKYIVELTSTSENIAHTMIVAHRDKLKAIAEREVKA